MFNDNRRKFLFKCDVCEMIVSVEFDTKEECKKVTQDKMILECPCGGLCKLLRD